MSVAGLAGFVDGFAGARQDQKDRAERKANADRQDRYIEALGAIPQGAGQPGGQAGGYGVSTSAQGGLGTAAAPTSGAGGGGLFGLLDAKEGGGNYNTLFGNAQNGGRFDGVDVSKMTLGQLYDFSDPNGEYGQWVKGQVGRVATPMGRGQIVGTTLRHAAQDMNLPDTTVYSPEIQTSMINHLAHNRIATSRSPATKRAALRAEWEGFRGVSDGALDQAISQFESEYGQPPIRPMGVSGAM